MSAQDVLINASVGAGIAFAGSLVISFFRSHRLLDLDRADQVRGLLRANGALEDELKTKRAPEISRKERAQRVLVAEKLSVMADAELAVIQYMLYHGQIDRAGLINSGIASTSAIDLAIHKAIESHLLQTSGHANRFQVNQEFVSALEHHFSD